jgi:hypothetical protein
MSRRFYSSIAIVFGLLHPLTLCAMQTQTFDLAAGEVNASWQGIGPIQMQKQADGILLSVGSSTGMLLTETQAAFLADAATVVVSTQQPTNLHFVWMYTDDTSRTTYSVPLSFSSGARRSASFSLTNVHEWLGGKKKVGLVLPPQTSILLHRIDFHRWNFFERVMENIQAFWTFDEYRPYSINFTWGPQLASNTIERNELYATLPPTSTSATLVTYEILLGILILVVAFTSIRPREDRTTQIVKRMSIVFLVVWVVFDMRHVCSDIWFCTVVHKQSWVKCFKGNRLCFARCNHRS